MKATQLIFASLASISAIAAAPLALAQAPKPTSTPVIIEHEDSHGGNPNSTFDGSTEVNLNQTTGNTKIQSIGAGSALNVRAGGFTTTLQAKHLRHAANDTKFAERTDGHIRTGTNITPTFDVFAQGNLLLNPFAGIHQEYMGDFGIGLYPINTDALEVRIEGGPGFLSENLVTGEKASFLYLRPGAGIRYRLNEVADLEADGHWIYSFRQSDDWRLITSASLGSKITNFMTLKVGFNFERRNTPVTGFKSNDTTTIAALVFKY